MILRSVAGLARVNSGRRGISHFDAKVGVTLMVTRVGDGRRLADASASSPKARETAA